MERYDNPVRELPPACHTDTTFYKANEIKDFDQNCVPTFVAMLISISNIQIDMCSWHEVERLY